jgi:uncharacterized protein (DUF1499 family)/NADH:ubiquinone oxidoreductase subunit 6 (subunit J)
MLNAECARPYRRPSPGWDLGPWALCIVHCAFSVRVVPLVPLIAFGVAALALVVLGAAGPIHRLGASLATAYAIMRWAEYIGVAASLLAIGAAIYGYRGRRWTGTIVAVLALVMGLIAVAIPLSWQRRAQRLPSIHDITTDLENPPAFQALLPTRANAPNRLDRTPQLPLLQREGYPDLAPITLPTPPGATFERALAVAQSHGWEIVTADKSAGRIEATDTTRWFGFTDDIVVRLTPWGAGTRVDVRSAARTGTGDLGRNASRIRRFLDDLSG